MARKRAGIVHIAKEGYSVTMDKDELELFLPHRGKALKIDGIDYQKSNGNLISGHKKISADDPDLDGHFPGKPVYPGVCIAECANLTAAILVLLTNDHIKGHPTVTDFHCKCIRPVLPGDEIEIKVELVNQEEVKKGHTFYSFSYVVTKKHNGTGGAKVVATGELTGTGA